MPETPRPAEFKKRRNTPTMNRRKQSEYPCRFPGCTHAPYGRTQDRGRHELLSHGMRKGTIYGAANGTPFELDRNPEPAERIEPIEPAEVWATGCAALRLRIEAIERERAVLTTALTIMERT